MPKCGSLPIAAFVAVLFLVPCVVLFSNPFETQSQQVSSVAVDTLVQDLKSPVTSRRREAAKLLGDTRSQSAIPDLVAAASDSDVGVRKEIVIALNKMLDVRALPGFIKLCPDPDKEIRQRSMEGILTLYLPREEGLGATVNKVANFINPWSDEAGETVVEPGIKVDPGAIAALSDRLRDVDPGIRVQAARALGILKARPAVPSLLASLKDRQTNEFHFEAIRATRKTGDPSAARDLMNYLNYSDSKVRNEAIYTIGRLRYRGAVPELTRLYERETTLPAKVTDKAFSEFLLDALAFIADPASKPLFEKEKQNPAETLRLHAYEGLARLADSSMVTNVTRAWLNEKEPRVRTAQAYAIFRMGRREFLDEVVNCLNSRGTSAEARMYLLELKPEDLPELYSETKNNEVSVREALAEIFGLIGDRGAIPVLQNLAADTRGQIAANATQAMRRISARMATQ